MNDTTAVGIVVGMHAPDRDTQDREDVFRVGLVDPFPVPEIRTPYRLPSHDYRTAISPDCLPVEGQGVRSKEQNSKL